MDGQRETILLPLKENLQKKKFPYRSNVWFDSLHRSIQRHRESFVNPMISNSFPTVDEENENEIRDDNQGYNAIYKNSVKTVKLFNFTKNFAYRTTTMSPPSMKMAHSKNDTIH